MLELEKYYLLLVLLNSTRMIQLVVVLRSRRMVPVVAVDELAAAVVVLC